MEKIMIAGFILVLMMMTTFAGCAGVKVPFTNSCNATCGGKCFDPAILGCCGAKIYALERLGWIV